MSQNLSQTFLAITRNHTDLEWLQGALAPLGQVVSAGAGSLDELLALVDVTFASLVFVGLDREHVVAQCALIEGALEAKPMLAIVALGDGMDNQLVLMPCARARDFAYGSRSSEVAGLVRRLSKRLPAVTPSTQLGGLTVLYGVQSNADGALLANHMAQVVQKSGQQTLLLDLGLPRGDSLALLGLESSFHFGDALRHLRRLDATLIDSAFTRCEVGVRILAYASHDEPLEHTSAAELYMLLSALRQHFQHIVVNLTGQPDSEALRTFVSHCDKLSGTPTRTCSTAAATSKCSICGAKGHETRPRPAAGGSLLARRRAGLRCLGQKLRHGGHRHPRLQPEVRLNAKNQGVSLFELAPREALRKACAPRRTPGQALRKPGQAQVLVRRLEVPMSGEKLFGATQRRPATPTTKA
jgi:pilus assembly protein CpaE